MRLPLITLTLAAAILAACSGNESSKASTDNSNAISADTAGMNAQQLILWKAQQHKPLSGGEIDSIINYLSQADSWIRLQFRSVKTEADFDSVEARYQRNFPYLEAYSAILEQYAGSISEAQLKRVKDVALSMGNSVDSIAAAIGIQ